MDVTADPCGITLPRKEPVIEDLTGGSEPVQFISDRSPLRSVDNF
jgi:hypothetical protein